MRSRAMFVSFVVAGVLLLGTAALAAETEPCLKNYSVKGSFFTQKTYSTWQEFPNVEPIAAFKAAYQNIVKAGWKISQSDKDLGAITASRKVGQTGEETLNVLIENAGKGCKVTLTRTLSMGLVAGKNEIQNDFCALMADVANSTAANTADTKKE